MKPNEFVRGFDLYVVIADPKRHGAFTLYDLTAPYVLTPAPREGDTIHAVLSGALLCVARADGRAGAYDVAGVRFLCRGRVTGHAGRSALLGEDSLEVQPDVLSELLPELIGDRERGWHYAPVNFEPSERMISRSWRRAGGGWEEEG